jgi:MOSC domain-containing protein YiiM
MEVMTQPLPQPQAQQPQAQQAAAQQSAAQQAAAQQAAAQQAAAQQAAAGHLTAVCVVHAIIPNPGETPDVTAIDKRPRDGRLTVGPLGLALDTQVDRKYHGGQEQALYAYADEDAAWWAGELDREVPAGLFGENLRTSGVDVSGAEIGERWRVGPAGGNDPRSAVLLEVTAPRIPCMTFQKRMDLPRWIKRFTRAGMPGAYLRVLTPGTLGAGDAVQVVRRPAHGVSVADLLAGRIEAYLALLEAHEAGTVSLGPKVGGHVRRRTSRVRTGL